MLQKRKMTKTTKQDMLLKKNSPVLFLNVTLIFDFDHKTKEKVSPQALSLTIQKLNQY